MLPRRHKLSRKSFPAYNAPSKTWRGNSLTIRFFRGRGAGAPQFAVVIAKKSYNLATKRNGIRRIVYLAIREHLADFSRFVGTKFVITPQKNISNINDTMRSDIEAFLQTQQ